MTLAAWFTQVTAQAGAFSPVLVDAAIKGAAVLGVTGVITAGWRRASAASRHLLWLAGVGVALLLPVFSAVLPAWPILPPWTAKAGPQLISAPPAGGFETAPEPAAVPVAGGMAAPAMAPTASGNRQSAIGNRQSAMGLELTSVLVLAWLAGAAAMLGRQGLGHLRLWQLQRRATDLHDSTWQGLLGQLCRQLGLDRPVRLLQSDRRVMPMVWGIFRVRLLLPADASAWPAGRRRIVLLHELAHARRRDALAQLMAQIACAAYWFNPLAWVAAHQMAIEREQACDDLVLSAGTPACEYADQLLQVAVSLRSGGLVRSGAIAMARPSTLEGRLRAILDGTRNRRGVARTWLVFGALLLAGGALPLAMLHPQASAQAASATTKALAATTKPATAPAIFIVLRDRAAQDLAATTKPATAPAGVRHFVQLVVGPIHPTFQGRDTTWDALPGLLQQVPDRPHTVLALGVSSGQMTIDKFLAAEGRAVRLVQEFGFEYLSNVGIQPLGSKGGPDQLLPGAAGQASELAKERTSLLAKVEQQATANVQASGLDQDINAKIGQLHLGQSARADVLKVLGKPTSYLWGKQTFTEKDLPDCYLMCYPAGLQICLRNDRVCEIRFEEPGPYLFDNALHVGSTLEEVLKVLGRPAQTVVGQKNAFVDGVLYEDIDGHQGWDYYSRVGQGIRMFFVDDKVRALYLSNGQE